MDFLVLDKPTVDHKDIDRIIKAYQKINVKTPATLKIKASVKMEDIDILLFGYLMLFKQSKPNTRIELHLPHNKLREKGALVFRLGQILTYAYLMTGNDAIHLYIDNYPEEFRIQRENKFLGNNFTISEEFMTMLLITEKNSALYKLLFEDDQTAYDPHWFISGINAWWSDVQEDTYKYYNRAIRQRVTADKHLHVESILELGRLAFLKSLYELDAITLYMASTQNIAESEKAQIKVQAGKLNNIVTKDGNKITAYEYFKEINFIFEDLKHKPLIYHFIFSQLTSSSLVINLTKHNTSDVLDMINGLWQFTKDLAYGLKEMAHNITQHATTHKGIITARLITGISLESLTARSGLLNIAQKDLAEELMVAGPGLPEALIEIHVADLGKKGIIPSLLDSSKKMLSNIPADTVLHDLISKDIEILGRETNTLSDLLRYDGHPMLNQQTKRSIAHYGLLIFNKLIRGNQGMVIISSPNRKGEIQSVIDPILKITSTVPTISTGTAVSVILPVSPGWKYKSHIPHTIELPIESSPEEMKGIESIFNIELAEKVHPKDDLTNKIILLSIQIPQAKVAERDNEMQGFLYIREKLQEYTGQFPEGLQQPNVILNIDLINCSPSASLMYRLTGLMELEYPKMTTLFSNLTLDLFKQIVQLNEYYLTYNDKPLPYWSEQNITLLYHYMNVGNHRFYFTDGLWGKEKSDFIHLNNLIHRNHFNVTTISYPAESGGTTQNIDRFNNLENNLAFYNRNVLLPFDLLIKGANDYTIFEHNALVLLNNPIKRNTLL